MTWLEEVIALYGHPRLRRDDPSSLVQLEDEGGRYEKRLWVWFPGNKNHHISIKRYRRWQDFKARTSYDYWVIVIGTHRADTASVEWGSRTEPDDDLMRLLLKASGFLDGGDPS